MYYKSMKFQKFLIENDTDRFVSISAFRQTPNLSKKIRFKSKYKIRCKSVALFYANGRNER